MNIMCKIFGHNWVNIIRVKECTVLKDKGKVDSKYSEYNQVIGRYCDRCSINDDNFKN